MMTLQSIRDGYVDGSTTPRELITAIVRSIRNVESDTAWIYVATDEQLEEQLAALECSSVSEKPLYGVPFAIKDNIDVKGWVTTAACPEFAYPAADSAVAVQKLLDAGAILVGKTNLDQFATGLVGTRSPYGIVPNVFDSNHICGGSSSGSASVVARGLVAFSLGTDTAGSGRVPAGFNNIVGFKPTPGLVSNAGVVPACKTLDCVSIFALTAVDASWIFEVIRSSIEEIESEEIFHPVQPSVARFQDVPRVGVPAKAWFPADHGYEAAYASAVLRIESAGHQVHKFDLAPFSEVASLLYSGPWVAERYAVIAETLASKPEAVNETVRQVIQKGTEFSAVDTFNAIYRLKKLEHLCSKIWRDLDVLMLPTAPVLPSISEVMQEPIRINSELGTYTNFVNLLGYSAIAVPAGFTEGGLPFGVTFVARGGYDQALLALANQWQLSSQLPLGMHLGYLPAPSKGESEVFPGYMNIAVVGAHLQGMPLHHQLRERRCIFLRKTVTANKYRLYALAGTSPPKPGLARNDTQGVSIEIEIYAMPVENVGSFLALIQTPLGLGNVELEDGHWVKGFICEPYGLQNAVDISNFGGWRAYIEMQKIL